MGLVPFFEALAAQGPQVLGSLLWGLPVSRMRAFVMTVLRSFRLRAFVASV